MFPTSRHDEKTLKFLGLHLGYILEYYLNLHTVRKSWPFTNKLHPLFPPFRPMSYHTSSFQHCTLKVNIFFSIPRFPRDRQKNVMVASFEPKWKHNSGCVAIIVQKHLDRRHRSEPIYEHFSELSSRVSGGARSPQLIRLMEQWCGRLIPRRRGSHLCIKC